MTQPNALNLLKRYAQARAGQFRQQDFITWAAHHGLSRNTEPEIIGDAFHEALAERVLELVPTPEAQVHPLYRVRGL